MGQFVFQLYLNRTRKNPNSRNHPGHRRHRKSRWTLADILQPSTRTLSKGRKNRCRYSDNVTLVLHSYAVDCRVGFQPRNRWNRREPGRRLLGETRLPPNRIHPVGEHPELCEVPADDECLSRLLRIMVASIHMAILGEKSCQTAHCLQPVLQHHRDGIRIGSGNVR